MSASKRLGDMTPEERNNAIARAVAAFQRELDASAPELATAIFGPTCSTCQGPLEPSGYGGHLHASDSDDTHTPTAGTVKLCADCIAHDCGSRDELLGRRVIHTSPRLCECVCDHGFEVAP